MKRSRVLAFSSSTPSSHKTRVKTRSSTNPPKPEGFDTGAYWCEKVRKAQEEYSLDQAIRFLLFDKNDRDVIGTANFSQFFRGPFQACYLGYAISKQCEAKGMIKEALTSAIKYIFTEKNVHRIMANYLTENARSATLLN